MAATSDLRGHKIVWKEKGWFYADTNEPADDSRPCIYCGRYPTEEGFDACLGKIEGCIAACCGHGDPSRAYVLKEGEKLDE